MIMISIITVLSFSLPDSCWASSSSPNVRGPIDLHRARSNYPKQRMVAPHKWWLSVNYALSAHQSMSMWNWLSSEQLIQKWKPWWHVLKNCSFFFLCSLCLALILHISSSFELSDCAFWKMLEIFRELRGLLRVSHVHIDSWVFRLHYSVTTTCMFAFSLIVSAKQYVGNPIDCIHSKDIPEEVLNTYCWIHSTYTIPSAFWKRIGFDVAHPGVDKTLDPEERRYHKYYQWVCFCLFFQVSIHVYTFTVYYCSPQC